MVQMFIWMDFIYFCSLVHSLFLILCSSLNWNAKQFWRHIELVYLQLYWSSPIRTKTVIQNYQQTSNYRWNSMILFESQKIGVEVCFPCNYFSHFYIYYFVVAIFKSLNSRLFVFFFLSHTLFFFFPARCLYRVRMIYFWSVFFFIWSYSHFDDNYTICVNKSASKRIFN